MGFNYGKEKALFDREWNRLRKQYKDLDMSDTAIQKLYDFDLSWFRMRRVYENHVQMLPEEEIDEQNSETRSNLFKMYSSLSSEFDENYLSGRYAWVETISDAKLAKTIRGLALEELELLTLIAIEGYTQREIACRMSCSQNAISKRLIKIKGVLKRQ